MSSGGKPKPVKSTFARRLVKWRTAKNFTQKEAAAQLGHSHRTLEYWENGRWSPRLEVAMKILARIEKDGF